MKQNLHIQSELLLNHIELTDEDLSELPPYPKVKKKKVQPRLIGIVCRCRSLDNYAFVVTNMYGINNTSTPYSPVQLYLEKSQWKDVTYLKEDMWITFELKKQPIVIDMQQLMQNVSHLQVMTIIFAGIT